MAVHLQHHAHVQTLGSLKSISAGWKIPFRYLRRLAQMPGFPQPYRFATRSVNDITTADYLYSREAVRAYLAEHLNELPQDDVSGYGSVKSHVNRKPQKIGRPRNALKRKE